MGNEEILTLRAKRIKYIQGLNLLRQQTMYIRLKIKQLKKSACGFEQ